MYSEKERENNKIVFSCSHFSSDLETNKKQKEPKAGEKGYGKIQKPLNNNHKNEQR